MYKHYSHLSLSGINSNRLIKTIENGATRTKRRLLYASPTFRVPITMHYLIVCLSVKTIERFRQQRNCYAARLGVIKIIRESRYSPDPQEIRNKLRASYKTTGIPLLRYDINIVFHALIKSGSPN